MYGDAEIAATELLHGGRIVVGHRCILGQGGGTGEGITQITGALGANAESCGKTGVGARQRQHTGKRKCRMSTDHKLPLETGFHCYTRITMRFSYG